MPVEITINTIADLDPTSPTGAESKAAGDDHIRNLKKAVKQTWPNVNAPVNATAAQLNLLVGKTDVATKADIDAAVVAATLPGVGQSANADKFFKGTGEWASVDLRGQPALNKGNSGTTAQVINYVDGEAQTLTMTGTHSLTVTGFPAGRAAGILVHLINYGAFALTTTGINWVKADGTDTTNFSLSGISFPTSGIARVVLYSMGDGVVYAKVAR